MPRSTKLVVLLLAMVLAMAAAQAQAAPGAAMPAGPASSPGAQQGALTSGEVLEVDTKEKRVLLKHGPIQNLGMDAMAMEFLVPDATLLASVKRGDKVRFAAIWKDGDYVITRIEVLKPHRAKRAKSRVSP
jgi:Cu/Ag efflux protein CusF